MSGSSPFYVDPIAGAAPTTPPATDYGALGLGSVANPQQSYADYQFPLLGSGAGYGFAPSLFGSDQNQISGTAAPTTPATTTATTSPSSTSTNSMPTAGTQATAEPRPTGPGRGGNSSGGPSASGGASSLGESSSARGSSPGLGGLTGALGFGDVTTGKGLGGLLGGIAGGIVGAPLGPLGSAILGWGGRMLGQYAGDAIAPSSNASTPATPSTTSEGGNAVSTSGPTSDASTAAAGMAASGDTSGSANGGSAASGGDGNAAAAGGTAGGASGGTSGGEGDGNGNGPGGPHAAGGFIKPSDIIGRSPPPDVGYASIRPGEFVVRSDMAAQYAPILEAINNGTYDPADPPGLQQGDGSMSGQGAPYGAGAQNPADPSQVSDGDADDYGQQQAGPQDPANTSPLMPFPSSMALSPDAAMQRLTMLPSDQRAALAQTISDPNVAGALLAVLGPPFAQFVQAAQSFAPMMGQQPGGGMGGGDPSMGQGAAPPPPAGSGPPMPPGPMPGAGNYGPPPPAAPMPHAMGGFVSNSDMDARTPPTAPPMTPGPLNAMRPPRSPPFAQSAPAPGAGPHMMMPQSARPHAGGGWVGPQDVGRIAPTAPAGHSAGVAPGMQRTPHAPFMQSMNAPIPHMPGAPPGVRPHPGAQRSGLGRVGTSSMNMPPNGSAGRGY